MVKKDLNKNKRDNNKRGDYLNTRGEETNQDFVALILFGLGIWALYKGNTSGGILFIILGLVAFFWRRR